MRHLSLLHRLGDRVSLHSCALVWFWFNFGRHDITVASLLFVFIDCISRFFSSLILSFCLLSSHNTFLPFLPRAQ